MLVDADVVYSRPRLDVSLDGALITSASVDDSGEFAIRVDVPPPHGWSDLYVVFNTIDQPDHELKDLRIARLEEIQWQPR